MRTVVESGECIVTRQRSTSDEALGIPFRLRVLEPDYLDLSQDGVTGSAGGPIIKGVEYDARGRRVAYWLYTYHPGALSLGSYSPRFESRRVPASEVLHIYDVERAGQGRGVPWLAVAMAKLQDFDDYDDAVLMQQKVAALFAGFVRDVEGQAARLGDTDPDDDELDGLEPGQLQYLPPGKDVTFATPPSMANHGGFSETTLRRIAASLGVTYEEMTQDYSKVNFSSARLARISHQANVSAWREFIVIPQLLDPVWRWAMEAIGALNGWATSPGVEWTAPPLPMIDPDKEGLALTRAVRGGLKTHPQAIRETGRDPDEHFAEYAEGLAVLDKLGIVLDSDPRRVTSSGQAQVSGQGDDGPADAS